MEDHSEVNGTGQQLYEHLERRGKLLTQSSLSPMNIDREKAVLSWQVAELEWCTPTTGFSETQCRAAEDVWPSYKHPERLPSFTVEIILNLSETEQVDTAMGPSSDITNRMTNAEKILEI